MSHSNSGLPRGRCPACGRDVALRVGGQLREHTATGNPADDKCAGSGYTIADVERGISREVDGLRRASS